MQGYSIEAWFHGERDIDVRDLATDVIGSPFRWRRATETLPICDRDTIDLLGEKVFFACGDRSEDHMVVAVTARNSGPLVHQAFRSVFERLACSKHPAVAECILAATTMDVYPWFTHSFHRSWPLVRIVDVGEPESPTASAALGGEAYWRRAGAQLRFVSAATLLRSAAPDPVEYARSVACTVSQRDAGWLFDCGWSRFGDDRT